MIRFGTVLNLFVCSEWLRFWPSEQAKSKKGRDDDSEYSGMWIFAKFRRIDGRPCSNTGNAGEGVCFNSSYFQMYLILLWICSCAGSVVAVQPIFSIIGYWFWRVRWASKPTSNFTLIIIQIDKNVPFGRISRSVDL